MFVSSVVRPDLMFTIAFLSISRSSASSELKSCYRETSLARYRVFKILIILLVSTKDLEDNWILSSRLRSYSVIIM